ncbi:PVC-type heme-binding CxxCH protein [Planctomycetaceae bacterium SH139]
MIARLSFWSAAALGWLVLTAVAQAQSQSPAAVPETAQQQASSSEELAGNEEVARIMREFAGRGELGDESQPLEPAQSLQRFVVPTDLKLELVAAEPIIAQPIHISFDVRGRMWVVQYRQYPFPAGLKVVRYDQHLRAVFDRVPEPPPLGTPGADRISVFEDRDGDGQFESSRDVITGLNIATSVAVGAGGIWVTNPPYLLCYPDADGDAEPDGEPVVHLSGFGLEDTHSVANSLTFGPDGWLYGVNGSTTTAQIKTHLGDQPTVAYEGQCVWRYHPLRHDFEIYAEGGGNPFGLEIDNAGQIFSGTNWGNTRGMHYPQGGYGVKNWGKHGPLTNPYAFGYLEHMPFSGDGRRFTEEFTIYDDDQLPSRFRGQLLAVNPLQRVVIASHLKRHGSSYATEDFESLITTDDRWFRPVDITLGPDGGLYLADWYDTRLTHVDPRDNWHKSSGRIYRLSANDDAKVESASEFDDILPSRTDFDLTELADEALLRLLGHPNRWLRMAALQVLSEARPSAIPALEHLLSDPTAAKQLAALWALSRLQGASFFKQDPQRLAALLASPHADVRRWTVRLLGDLPNHEQPVVTSQLVALAERETDAQVRAQLASTARRLSASSGLTLSLAMLSADRQIDHDDPHTKLLLWWALESHCRHDIAAVMDSFAQPQPPWNSGLFRAEILPRLAKRGMLSGGPQDFQLVHQLLLAAPDDASRQLLLRGVDQGLAETGISTLPDDLKQTLTRLSGESPHQALVLRLRQGDEEAVELAMTQIASANTRVSERMELIEILGQQRPATALGGLLNKLSDASVAVRRVALNAVARYDDPAVGRRLAAAYQSSMDSSTGLRPIAVRVMASRPSWARTLIAEIDALKIPAELVTPDMVLQMQSHGDPQLNAAIERLWGQVRATPEEKQQQIAQLRTLVSQPVGDLVRGKQIYVENCGKCHRLFGEGGQVGPDLTGYERTNFDFLSLAIVDPSAAIREEFTAYQLLTLDGQLLVGLLVDQSAQAVTLRTAEGQTLRIAREDIETLKASPVSLMPEGLLDSLTDQQRSDLLKYLSSTP